MRSLLPVILLLSLTSLSFTPTTVSSTAATSTLASKPTRLVLKLLHRDYVLRNRTLGNIAAEALDASTGRCLDLSGERESSIQTHDTRAHLRLGNPTIEFYVSFSIGEPPVSQLAVLDTGSDLVWVECQPCQPCAATTFDPSKSLTYSKLHCKPSYCTNDCRDHPDECVYDVRYVSGPDSQGTIGLERFNFETSDEGKTFVDDVPFGCGHNHVSGQPELFTGVFGLGPSAGRSALSVVHKFGSKFSYCIGSVTDVEYRYNMLILGEGAMVEGDSTPVNAVGAWSYYVTLEGISVGEKMLDIDPDIFKRRSNFSHDGVLFDTGTAMSWLVPSAYRTLREEIEDVAEGVLQRHQADQEWRLCYSGEIGRDLHGFPVTTFHFAGGADLVLDVYSLFFQVHPALFCLAMGPSDAVSKRLRFSSLIGSIAQQNYNVAYDLVNNQMYLQRIDCQLLDE